LATDVVMPRLSDSMEEGTVLKWLKGVGDEVTRGEAIVEIETDKANMTYEADTDGVLVEVIAQEGDTLAIGEVIAKIGNASEVKAGGGDSGGESSSKAQEPRAEQDDGTAKADEQRTQAERGDEPGKDEADGDAGSQPAERETSTATERAAPPPPSNGDGRIKASPVARRMAQELGVELERLEGSGPGGRIVKTDVEAAAGGASASTPDTAAEPKDGAAERPAAPEQAGQQATSAPSAEPGRTVGAKGAATVVELSRLQQTITRRMAESKATAPEFSLSLDVDMTAAVELRSQLKQVADPAPSFNDMIVKAAATALGEHPRVNGAYRDGRWELYERVNVGVAVAAEDTLIVPTIFDASQKSLGQISRDARAMIERVRDQTITPPELAGGTFTVSNLGMYGVEHFTAIINPPQACILTVGALAKKPAVDDRGRVVARDQLTLTLVCDHRILYGADGAKFLARVKELLQQPLSLAL
jgi:pyruvate dehydrogenase E2 component (dihydrolipoamide acetyltransferase)